MTVSSRTPEGLPSHCPLCGAETNLEFSDPAGDAPCPSCGHLLWKSGQVLEMVRHSIAKSQSIPLGEIQADSLLEELQRDSLGFVDLLMELEDDFGVVIPDEYDPDIHTVEDLVRKVLNEQLGNP